MKKYIKPFLRTLPTIIGIILGIVVSNLIQIPITLSQAAFALAWVTLMKFYEQED